MVLRIGSLEIPAVIILKFEPAHEIMVIFVLLKLILQMCMYSHLMRLDVWFLVGPSVYFPTLCVRTANAVIRLRGCAGFPEPSLVAWAFAGRPCNKYHNRMSWLIWRIWLHFLRPKKKMPCFWKPYLDVSKRFRKNRNQCRPWSDLLQDVDLHCLPRPVLRVSMSHVMRKPDLCHMRTTKAQISLRIHAVGSAPLFFVA